MAVSRELGTAVGQRYACGSAGGLERRDKGIVVEEIGGSVAIEVGGLAWGAGAAFEAGDEGVVVEEVDGGVAVEGGGSGSVREYQKCERGAAEGSEGGEWVREGKTVEVIERRAPASAAR